MNSANIKSNYIKQWLKEDPKILEKETRIKPTKKKLQKLTKKYYPKNVIDKAMIFLNKGK